MGLASSLSKFKNHHEQSNPTVAAQESMGPTIADSATCSSSVTGSPVYSSQSGISGGESKG